MQYLCPRQSSDWQWVKTLFWVRTFDVFADAAGVAESLIWQYHSARVVDLSGNVLYVV